MTVPTDPGDLWKELHSGVSAFVRRRIRNRADADDVVQGVFLRVHRGLESLRDEQRVHAWIYRAARNAVIDHYRSKGRSREEAVGLWDDLREQDHGEPFGSEAGLRELAGCLRPLMARLSEPDRLALARVDIDGVSQVAAARELKLSTSGMKSRVQRARGRLKELVEACCLVERGRRGDILSHTPREGHCGECGETRECSSRSQPAV